MNSLLITLNLVHLKNTLFPNQKILAISNPPSDLSCRISLPDSGYIIAVKCKVNTLFQFFFVIFFIPQKRKELLVSQELLQAESLVFILLFLL